MAIVSAWTTKMAAEKLPSAFTPPTVATPTGSTILRADFVIDVADSLDNATTATAMTAIGDAVKTAWDANYDTAILGLDASAAIHVRLNITSVLRRWTEFEYGDPVNQLKAGTPIFRCTGYAEYAVDPA